MAARAGRNRRADGVGRVAKPTTVRLTQIDVAERVADALKISRDAYLDALLAREAEALGPNGVPDWWPTCPPEQRELPLMSA